MEAQEVVRARIPWRERLAPLAVLFVFAVAVGLAYLNFYLATFDHVDPFPVDAKEERVIGMHLGRHASVAAAQGFALEHGVPVPSVTCMLPEHPTSVLCHWTWTDLPRQTMVCDGWPSPPGGGACTALVWP